MFDAALSPQQLQVINALSEGLNSTDAAAQAGVHRNTIANWRRNYLPFRESLAHAQYDRALFFREKAEDMVDLACQTLHNLLNDPKASPSVRLRAAIFILQKAATPPPPKEQLLLEIEKIHVSTAPPVTIDTDGNILRPVHNPAQRPAPANAQTVHNGAQSEAAPAAPPAPAAPQTIRRDTPKVGRNEACPCGSGRKYKRCCLDHPQAAAQTAAA